MQPLRIKKSIITRKFERKKKTYNPYLHQNVYFGYRHLKHSSPRTASIKYTIRNRLELPNTEKVTGSVFKCCRRH